MIDTATITLGRLRALESSENALKAILTESDRYSIYRKYGGDIFFLERTDPVEKLISELESIRNERDSLALRLKMCEEKPLHNKRGFWELFMERRGW